MRMAAFEILLARRACVVTRDRGDWGRGMLALLHILDLRLHPCLRNVTASCQHDPAISCTLSPYIYDCYLSGRVPFSAVCVRLRSILLWLVRTAIDPYFDRRRSRVY